MQKSRFSAFLGRVKYRLWQFKQVLFPKLSRELWNTACEGLDAPMRLQLEKLRRSEKAHVMRVYTEVCKEPDLSEAEQKELKELALLHDIGKTFTKPSLFFKVAKVLFSLPNNAHCIKGALFLKKQRADKKLVIRTLRHHCPKSSDRLLQIFMQIDDRC